MTRMKSLMLATALSTAIAGMAQAAEPKVVVSIKPVHSLVAAVMQGVGEPSLIVEGGASPHTYSMKPSNAAALQEADVIFWVGHGLEAFLAKPLETLGRNAKRVELEGAPGLRTLPFREGGAFEAHNHGEDGHDHAGDDHDDHGHDHAEKADEEHGDDHGGTDMHLWLDPMNAKAMAKTIAETLSASDPANAAAYAANLEVLNGRIDRLDAEIAETVAPVKDKPFVVFHDAYQYFETHYGVRVAGSITVSPETLPGAERLTEIRDKITELGATCVFAEPQFEPKLVHVVIEGTSAKSGTLDPEGGALAAGPDLYFDLMKGIATSLRACLTSAS